MSKLSKNHRGILHRICSFIPSLLLLAVSLAKADVTQNVTFTVKNDGRVEAWTDIGTFDANGQTLTVNAAQMPTELRDNTPTEHYGPENIGIHPIGHYLLPRSNNSPIGIRIPLKVKEIEAQMYQARKYKPRGPGDPTNCGSWSAMNATNKLTLFTSGNPFANSCYSVNIREHSNFKINHFMLNYLAFSYLESEGGWQWLATQKLPAGTYTSQALFRLSHQKNPSDIVWVSWYVNLRIIVEPSMAEVNMPSTMQMVDKKTANNRVVGEGAVQISAQGTLGRNLRIETRSANGGRLIKGSEEIPYTLSVSTLYGDYKPYLLIDSGHVQAPAVIPLYGRDFDYPLRLNAHFDTPMSRITTGYFRDRVTLVFSTSDVP